MEFGKALTSAELEAGAGDLKTTRWSDGKSGEEVVKFRTSAPTVHRSLQLPETERVAEPDFPKHLRLQKAQAVRDAISAIRVSTEKPGLIRIR